VPFLVDFSLCILGIGQYPEVDLTLHTDFRDNKENHRTKPVLIFKENVTHHCSLIREILRCEEFWRTEGVPNSLVYKLLVYKQ
jgi:hypothetical protein